MPRQSILLQVLLLVALAVRICVGAPCCTRGMSPSEPVAQTGHHQMAAAHDLAPSGHGEHDSDNTANPCCSACGPTLPQQPLILARTAAPAGAFALAPEHPVPSLEAIRAYQARGPPSRV
ncbi:hypothetical protein [Aurantiacibacter odishensis]|uniref:hypothetical protein n=1 Tax=Aurantiacibacter odishensis TaxID=1155476 RepID=UPI0013C4164A|nr:hypothetical protein [Aurantiacibacter odishensis]